MEDRSFNLHVWVSDTGMGDVPSDFHTGTRYYICYELIDLSTGQRATNISISAKETVRNSKGVVFEHTYENSNNNWISFVPDSEDTYSGTVTITGDTDVSCSVSFNAWADTRPAVKVWAWEGDQSNEISSLGVGQTAYISYLIRDNNTKSNLNDVTTFWNQGDGYTVRLEIRTSNNVLLESKTYKNNDSAWISFQPSTLGEYKLIVIVSGNMTGTQEKTFTAIEKEHAFGIWRTTQPASCTSSGIKTRECSLCGHTETQTIPATGHSYGSWTTTKEATCTASGTKTRTCSKCGNKETQTIPSTGHSYVTTVVAPTTTERGYTLHKCSRCGDSYKDKYTDPTNPVNPNDSQVIVESKNVIAGNKVLVNISIKNNPGIWGMDLNVNYDKSLLTLTNVTNGAVFSSSEWTPGNLNKDKYILSYEASGFDDVKKDGVLATLEFAVNSNAKPGNTSTVSITYNQGDIINSNFVEISFETVSGKINIISFIYGDVNGDGLVNKKDSLLLKMYLADNSVTIDKKAADVYLDNSVNKKDSLYLKQYLAGLDVVLGQ